MTKSLAAQAVNSRQLTKDEIAFATKVIAKCPSLDMAGLDVARTSDNKLYLMEVNRSPGFAKFYELTNINLASKLYKDL